MPQPNNYAFAPHSEQMWGAASSMASQLYALIDAGQLPDAGIRLRRELESMVSLDLFADTFAHAAMEASPLIVWLTAPDAATPTQQIERIDALCTNQPIISYLKTSMSLTALGRHLQTLMRIDTPDAAFLLRYADPRLLEPILQTLTPHQRATFLAEIDCWWVTDHRGQCKDVSLIPHDAARAPLPLKFDAAQVDALLDACLPSIMICQLRNLEPDFAARLNPAEQADFVDQTLADAYGKGIEGDAALTEWCFSRWLENASTQGATPPILSGTDRPTES